MACADWPILGRCGLGRVGWGGTGVGAREMAPLLLPLLLGATALRQSELAAPSGLLVDLMHAQPPPLLLVTASARPSFSFLSGSSVMTHYRIAVTDLAGSVGWDSGRTEAPAAAHIPCGANLTAGASYSWTAEYWDDAGHHSPRATGAFTVGLLGEADWQGAEWLGGGQRQFKLALGPRHRALLRRDGAPQVAKLHVASPGGVTVEVNKKPVGDPVGLSLWADNSKSVHYMSYDLSELSSASESEIVLFAGGGFWASPTPGQAWGAVAPAMAPAQAPAVRILLVLEGPAGPRVLLRSGGASDDGGSRVLGRRGPVPKDDPWRGTVTDTTLPDAQGWAAAQLAPTGRLFRPSGTLFPLPSPYATRRGDFGAVSVTTVKQRPGTYLYQFPVSTCPFL